MKNIFAIFFEDFQQFIIKKNFKIIEKTNIVVLQNCLRNNKVYIKKTRLYF